VANYLKALLPASILLLTLGQPQAADQTDLIKRGEYLAIAGDCGACHTEEGKAPFSGGHAISSPIGTIFSSNITPSNVAGIGHYTEAQFADALRKGKRADGSQLYPAMPYTAYGKINDDDMAALYAYFMHGVKPVDTQPEKTALPFPFNLRFSMAAWNWLYLDNKPFTPDSAKTAQWNRGAYLVEGLTHCSTCHTPRSFLMAEQQQKNLQGASLGTWFAPDITAATLKDRHWTRQMLADYLATGHSETGATAGGPMLEAIDKSFSRLTPADRLAMATYLLPEEGTVNAPAVSSGLIPVTGDDLPEALPEGERLYRNNCAACHNLQGEGLRGLPALKNHPVLKKPTADNVAMAVLQGVWPENAQSMPGFAAELNDKQVASITRYVMKDIGNSDVSITAERVKALRQGGEPSPLLLLSRIGMAGGIILVILALLYWGWRRRR
jgi:mono/diheme cytochrome c family protein